MGARGRAVPRAVFIVSKMASFLCAMPGRGVVVCRHTDPETGRQCLHVLQPIRTSLQNHAESHGEHVSRTRCQSLSATARGGAGGSTVIPFAPASLLPCPPLPDLPLLDAQRCGTCHAVLLSQSMERHVRKHGVRVAVSDVKAQRFGRALVYVTAPPPPTPADDATHSAESAAAVASSAPGPSGSSTVSLSVARESHRCDHPNGNSNAVDTSGSGIQVAHAGDSLALQLYHELAHALSGPNDARVRRLSAASSAPACDSEKPVRPIFSSPSACSLICLRRLSPCFTLTCCCTVR